MKFSNLAPNVCKENLKCCVNFIHFNVYFKYRCGIWSEAFLLTTGGFGGIGNHLCTTFHTMSVVVRIHGISLTLHAASIVKLVTRSTDYKNNYFVLNFWGRGVFRLPDFYLSLYLWDLQKPIFVQWIMSYCSDGNVDRFGIFVFQFRFYFLALILTYQFLIHDN